MELLERTGRVPAAMDFAKSFPSPSGLAADDRARLSTVRGLIAKHLGHISEAEHHFLRACQHAEQSGSLELLCWAQLRLLGVTEDSPAKERVSAIRSELRRNVDRAGCPNVSVAFHIFSAEHEAKHGRLAVSRFHGEIAESLLSRHPNVWLTGLLDLQKSCLSYLEGDFAVSIKAAQRALDSSEESGHVQTRLVALADMAAAYLAVGQPARANQCIAFAMKAANPTEQIFGLLVETLAEAQLESRDLVGCGLSLTQAESMVIDFQQHRSSWYQDWNLRTKVRLLQRRGEWKESLQLLQNAVTPHRNTFSDSRLRVLEALALSRTGQSSMAASLLCCTYARPIDTSPLLQGLVQAALAGLLESEMVPELALGQSL